MLLIYVGSGEYKDTQSRRAPMIKGGKSPPNSRGQMYCRNLLARQNKTQPERNGENPTNRPEREILGKQRIQIFAKEGSVNKNAQNQNYMKIPPKEKKVRKTKKENKTAQTKANEQNQAKDMQRGKCNLGMMVNVMRGRKEEGEITPGCVYSVVCVVRPCDMMRAAIYKAWAAILGSRWSEFPS